MRETDSTFISSNEIILREFNIKLQECYELYKRKYPILDDMSSHRLNLDTKIQKQFLEKVIMYGIVNMLVFNTVRDYF